MKIDSNWKRPVRIANYHNAKGDSELACYDSETSQKIDNISGVTVRMEARAALEAEITYTNERGVHETITLKDLDIDVRALAASRDWEKLNPMQRAGLQTFRDRAVRGIIEETEAFYRLYPELRLTWNFTSDALFRTEAENISPGQREVRGMDEKHEGE